MSYTTGIELTKSKKRKPKMKNKKNITDIAQHIICCKGYYELGMNNIIRKIEDMIDKDIEFQMKQLKGNYDEDKPIKWRIAGMMNLKNNIGSNRK